jgi:excisionase family DNA binding protein
VVPLLTKTEVAQLLKKPVSWVKWAQQRKLLPYVRVGQQVRFRAEDIQAWIAANAVSAHALTDCKVARSML